MRIGTVVRSSLTVGLIGFGGGAVLIPLLHTQFVERSRLIDEDTFGTHTVVTNLTPGAFPVKMAALAGTRAGVLASVLAGFAMGLPGALLAVVLLAAFASLGQAAIRWIEYAAFGIALFILLVVAGYIAGVIRKSGRARTFIGLTLLCFLATGAERLAMLLGRLVGQEITVSVPQLSTLQLIALALVVIAVASWRGRGQDLPPAGCGAPERGSLSAASVMSGITLGCVVAGGLLLADGWRFMGLVVASTLSSFGGGAAYIAVADGFFVAPGLIDPDLFHHQLVPVANALPGPILIKLVSGMGYTTGAAQGGAVLGVSLAVLAFAAAISACSAVALFVMAFFDRIKHSSFAHTLSTWILPVICGLLCTTSCSLWLGCIDTGTSAGAPTAAVAWAVPLGVGLLRVVQRRFRASDVALLLLAGTTSTLLLALLGSGAPA
ncbi:MAG: chromate transporter [Propionibacteriaceae bacterium]|nr:chromate transporter [Propionibacteriaceae bacterium]